MSRQPRQHPAAVTAQRVTWAGRRYADRFTVEERAALSVVLAALHRIAANNPLERN